MGRSDDGQVAASEREPGAVRAEVALTAFGMGLWTPGTGPLRQVVARELAADGAVRRFRFRTACVVTLLVGSVIAGLLGLGASIGTLIPSLTIVAVVWIRVLVIRPDDGAQARQRYVTRLVAAGPRPTAPA